jgi:hypothetical protein
VRRYIHTLLFFLVIGINLPAQDNSIKGFVCYSPYVPNHFIGIASLGYTRDMSDFIAFDFNAGYYKAFDSKSGSYNSRLSFIPSFRYYIGENNLQNSGLWITGYPVIGIANYSNGTKSYRTFEYGIGAGVGFRVDISKNARWFMDMGLSASYCFSDILYYKDETAIDPNSGLYSVVEDNYDFPPSELWVPRAILQFGFKF